MNMKTKTVEDSKLLETISSFYASELSHPVPMDFLDSNSLKHFPSITKLRTGYSNGALVKTLSAEQKINLQDLGFLDKKGKELLANCLVIPLFTEDGQTCGFYGYGIGKTNLGIEHLVPQDSKGFIHQDTLSVWNEEIILVDTLFDLLSLMSVGIENIFPLLGGIGDHHVEALKNHRVKKMVLTKNLSAMEIQKDKLLGFGIQLVIPHFQDNESFYSLTQSGMNKETLLEMMREWKVVSPVIEKVDPRKISQVKDVWVLENGNISYKVLGVKDSFSTSLRVSIKVEKDDKRFFDQVDLMSSRSRASFKDAAAQALALESALIDQDLLLLLDRLEEDQEKKLSQDIPITVSPMTEDQEKIGMEFLTSPDILEQIVTDLETLGYVGETINKQIAYLAATSRKLFDPISIMIISQSGSGKSYLIDSVKKLIPPEDVVNLTSLSDQALNYLPDGGLEHKLLLLGESVHSDKVDHAVREMLSAKELNRMVVAKDERTGKSVTRIQKTKAVVSLMMSSTSHDMNKENASRFFLLHADESEEQTRRIHEQQNKKYSLENLSRAKVTSQIVDKHHAAQRLLKPVVIINPFASTLEFPSTLMRSRRDNQALNNLILSFAFLRQYQKEVKEHEGITYIEVDESDIKTAWYLFHEGVIKSTYSELPQSLVRLYEEVRKLCREKADSLHLQSTEVGFEQRDLSKRISWLTTGTVKAYLHNLIEKDLILIKNTGLRGQRLTYGLIEELSFDELEGIFIQRVL